MRRPTAAREALGVSPLMKTGRADASRIESVPLVSAVTKPFVFFAGRPAAQRAADAWFRWFPVAFNLTVRRNGGSITLWTHLFGSLKSLFFGKAASIPPDHTHLFPTETSVLDRHPEERVLVLLIVGGESILVK